MDELILSVCGPRDTVYLLVSSFLLLACMSYLYIRE
jgi:hypothetical protein